MSSRPMDAEPFRQELLIVVDGLKPGMFVSRLDRPWLGTGFPFEGMLVNSEDEIEHVRRLCRHVTVDLARGRAPAPGDVVLETAPAAAPVERPGTLRALVGRVFGSRDVAVAENAHARLEESVRDVMEGLRSGGRLDADKLRQGVDTMLDSITHNPDTLPWVMEMRRKGDYIYQHGLACSIWAAAFGRHLGYDREDLRELAVGALLCDVGKVRLSADLLGRAGPLDATEMRHLRSHVDESRRIVAETPGLSPLVLETVAHHHERHDGSGYPAGLRGLAIPMFARIAGLVDSYDAMVSTRPYAASRSAHQAVMELYESRDRLFQAELVEQFIRTCGVYPTGTLVELTDGRVGVVMSVNTLKRLRPCVMLLLDAEKRAIPRFDVIDLAAVDSDEAGQPLNVRGGLPNGAYGIDRASLFLD